MRLRILLIPVLLTLLLVVQGCQRSLPPAGRWCGSVTLYDGKQLPFQMYLDLSKPTGFFLVDDEQTPIPEIQIHGDSMNFIFTEFNSAMRGLLKAGKYSGQFFRYRKDTSWIAFEATSMADQPQAAEQAAPTVTKTPLVGKFRAYFTTAIGLDSLTTATFWIKRDTIFGTLIAPDGDYGLMTGVQQGDDVQLNRFTGWQATMIKLARRGTSWSGKVYNRNNPPVSFALEPLASASSVSANRGGATMRENKKPFHFSGRTLAGDSITSNDKRFNGKALLVEVMGTWCHNCMDAAPLLQQLYAEFQAQGLEVVGLAFELSNDFNAGQLNLQKFKARYGITYPLVFSGSTESQNVEAKIRSQVNNFGGYPSTFFIARNGLVKEIHSGFRGPGTGEEYQNQVQDYYRLVKELLRN
ncbi:MAG: TlpA disulfide reductase family protein [bacterium]